MTQATNPSEIAPPDTPVDGATRLDPATGVREEVAFLPGGHVMGTTHLPRDTPRGGVVVCSPLGWGFTRNYRREVLLARQLAERGLAVQRFHYRGLGESHGRFEDVTFARLVEDAAAAADHLAARAGVATTAVVGSRLGALVALALARRSGGSDVVLWDPVADGRAYVRDLVRLRNSWRVAAGERERLTPDEEIERTGVLDVIGFRMAGSSLDDLRALDVAGVLGDGPAPRRALLLHIGRDTAATPKQVRSLAQQLVVAGTEVDTAGVEGKFEWWLRSGFDCEERSEVGRQLITATTEWLHDRAGQGVSRPARAPDAPDPQVPAATRLDRPVFFTAGDETLFGVVTEPTERRSDVGVVLLSGGDYQLTAGPFGVWARLAHQLADVGVASIRCAYRGVSESTGSVDDFDLTRPFTEDLDGARRVLAELGLERVYLVGRCFGARTVCAAGSEGVVGVGLVSLAVREESLRESVLTRPQHVAPMPAGSLVRRVLRRDVLRILSDPRLRTKAVQRVTATVRHAMARRRGELAADQALGWINTELIDDLERMAAAETPILLVHGTGERQDIQAAMVGRLGRIMKRGHVEERVVDDVNAMYEPVAVQEALFDHIIDAVLPGNRSDGRRGAA